jgi:hypothetical protein
VTCSYIRSEAMWRNAEYNIYLKTTHKANLTISPGAHLRQFTEKVKTVHQLPSMRECLRMSLPTVALTCRKLCRIVKVKNADSISRFRVKLGTGPPSPHFGWLPRFLSGRGCQVSGHYPQTLCAARSSIACSCVTRR